MEFKDYYSRLGVEKHATPEDIKRACGVIEALKAQLRRMRG